MHRAGAKLFSLRNVGIGAGITATTGAGILLYALENSVQGAEFVAHPPHLHWPHFGLFDSFDYKSVRRGYEVYKQVCAACHSLKYIKYRHFVDVFMTEKEAKAEAAEQLVKDIDDAGNAIERPGLLTDGVPKPYPNNKAAAAANNGAIPPDLTHITLARHGGDDYLFALLTSYMDPPAGVNVEEGKAYNPYFPGGGVIAMPQQLFDDGIDYKDGTSATQAQQAKDVVSFLHWCGEPYHDTRKRLALKILVILPFLTGILIYWKRYIWAMRKAEKYVWVSVKGREPPKFTQQQPPKSS